MAAGDKVQIGKQWKVEYGAFVYAGYQPTSVGNAKTGNVQSIMDTRDAVCTHIVTNPGEQLVLNLMIEDAGGSITPLAVGARVQITPPTGTAKKYIVLASIPISHTNGITTTQGTFTREDSMASTYDA